MQRLLAPLVALAVVIVSGVVSGLQTDRWGLPADIPAAAERLQHVPVSFSAWQSQEVPISGAQLEQAQAVGHLSRSYVNTAENIRVDVLIVCGRHGPIAVHPPTACFTGAGHKLLGPPERHVAKIKGASPLAEFWVADFATPPKSGVSQQIRTFWTWTNDGRWQAPDNPRITFAGSKPLYKMYVSRVTTADRQAGGEPENDSDASLDDDPSVRFLNAFVPELEKVLFFELED